MSQNGTEAVEANLIQPELGVDKSHESNEKPRRQGFNSETARQYGQQPGQPSRNPKGRPKGVRYLSEAFRFWLAARNELNPESTNADEIAGIVGAAALAGDLKACQLLLERTEGRSKGEMRRLGEDWERLKAEQEVYYRMEDEGLDYAEVVAAMEEEDRQEVEEKERELKALVRQIRREGREKERMAKEVEKERIAAEAKRRTEEIERAAEALRERLIPEEKPEEPPPQEEQPSPWGNCLRKDPPAETKPETETKWAPPTRYGT